MDAVIAFAAGGLFTAAIGAGFAEWRARQEEGRGSRRDQAARIRQWHLDRLADTRSAVLRYCRWLTRLALELDTPGLREGPGPLDLTDLSRQNFSLIGEAGGQAFLDTVPFEKDQGPVDRSLAVSRLEAKLMGLLEDQELRALRDEPLLEMTEETAAKVGTTLPSSG